ncbi:MAG TPA: glycosyltransferase family 2 protein [Terracidiphilus sp.]|nr:glycosyltransferase family 2 protein [Terracidiphilus sp.]
MPAVSVIMPIFNAQGMVVPAIESVLRQTFTDFEIIAVDDCSSDQSWNQVQALQDSRIRSFQAARNSGASAARNLGIRQARGEWLAFLDADDQWSPHHLEVMLGCANGHVFVAPSKLGCVPDAHGWLRPLEEPAEVESNNIRPLDHSSFAAALGREYVFTKSAFVKEHRIGFLETGGRADCGGDWMYYVSELLLKGAHGCVALKPTYLYRVTGYHNSSSYEAMAQEFSTIDRLSKDRGVPLEVRDSLARSLPDIRRRLNAAALRSRQWKQFFRLLAANPSNIFYVAGASVSFLFRKLQHSMKQRGLRST